MIFRVHSSSLVVTSNGKFIVIVPFFWDAEFSNLPMVSYFILLRPDVSGFLRPRKLI